MLGKRSRPAIGKLAGAIRSGFMNSATIPRSPLDCKMKSPRGLKNYDQGGIGLAIVVALDKPTMGGEVLAKYAICGPFSARSSPIPVHPCPSTKGDKSGKFKGNHMMEMEGLDEEFTYVTCHGPNQSITTRVYYDGCEFGKISQNDSVLKVSPLRLADNRYTSSSHLEPESESESESGFLSSCHLCRKTLHGKDIYMYRGEKAFCSAECRQMQIGIDERKEQCRSEASISSSPCPYATRGQIFFSTGIVAV